VLWTSNVAVGQTATGGIRGDVVLFLDRGTLIAADPVSGSVAKFDPPTGKFQWQRAIPADQQPAAPTCSVGASLSGRRLLVYGPRTGIVDLDTGDLEWSFESWQVKKFPVKLLDIDAPPEEPAQGAWAGGAGLLAVPMGAYGGGPSNYFPGGVSYVSPQSFQSYPQTGNVPQAPQVAPQPVAAFGDSDSEAGAPGGIPQTEFGLTGPAASWTNLVRQNPACFGHLTGPTLLLGGPQGIRSIRLDLPYMGHRFDVAGELTGVTGRYACVSNGAGLQILDLVRGSARTLAPGQAMEGAQCVVDGPAIYFTAYSGIVCFRTATAERLFAAKWPASVEVWKPPAPAPAQAPTPNYGTGSYTVPPPALPAYGYGSTSYATSPAAAYAPTPYPVAPPSAYPPPAAWGDRLAEPVPPNIARVSGGVLYTLAAPTRVVALTGADDGK
jgi:hypothetical protein